MNRRRGKILADNIGQGLQSEKDLSWMPTVVPLDAASIAAGAALVDTLNLHYWIEPMFRSRRHSDGGLIEFLLHPALHHRDTLFPGVRLSREEATRIAAYVRSRQPAPSSSLVGGNAAAGMAAVAASCVSCHTPSAAGPTTLSMEDIAKRDWTVRGCISGNRSHAPDLRLSPDQVGLLLAFRNADRDLGIRSLRLFSQAEYASRQLITLRCTQCHTGENKLPDITFAGEKLNSTWLVELLQGKHPMKTRPWLETRMPAFASRAANLALGLAALHGVSVESDRPDSNPERARMGAKIAGAEGYSCITCHDSGAKNALQEFEGQGPNLQLTPQRLRFDYFQRWMHFPQRIAPTTIMPRYTQDRDRALLDAYFEAKAEPQFEAVWQWMCELKPGEAKQPP